MTAVWLIKPFFSRQSHDCLVFSSQGIIHTSPIKPVKPSKWLPCFFPNGKTHFWLPCFFLMEKHTLPVKAVRMAALFFPNEKHILHLKYLWIQATSKRIAFPFHFTNEIIHSLIILNFWINKAAIRLPCFFYYTIKSLEVK